MGLFALQISVFPSDPLNPEAVEFFLWLLQTPQ